MEMTRRDELLTLCLTGASTEFEVATDAQAESNALLDYSAVVGTVVEVWALDGYQNEDSKTFGALTGGPFKVRVVGTSEPEVCHWNMEFLDAYWNVELAEPDARIPDDARSFWIHSPVSYFVKK